MGELYGKASEIIARVVGTLYAVCMISLELFVLVRLCEPLFGIHSVYGIVIGGIILALYTTYGGIRSVALALPLYSSLWPGGGISGRYSNALAELVGQIFKIKLSAQEKLSRLERRGNTRGLYVKLADRMHNMRTISGHRTLSKQQRVAEETAQLYVPLAERLRLHEAAQELKSRCAQVLSRGPR